jgi:predicted transcriptional regulator of viral defense system
MQSLTKEVFKLAPPGGLFDMTVVRNLFSDRSEGACKVLVHRAETKGEIIRLKPGLFILAEDYRKSQPHPFVIAAALHSPSHVSLESALSFHGLIPEAVYQVSNVTAARSRKFETPIGIFTFQHVAARNPKAGVEAVKLNKTSWAFVATPLRAIADLVYLRKRITWERDGLAFLTESMRIEIEDLTKMSFNELDELNASLLDRRTKKYLSQLHLELNK